VQGNRVQAVRAKCSDELPRSDAQTHDEPDHRFFQPEVAFHPSEVAGRLRHWLVLPVPHVIRQLQSVQRRFNVRGVEFVAMLSATTATSWRTCKMLTPTTSFRQCWFTFGNAARYHHRETGRPANTSTRLRHPGVPGVAAFRTWSCEIQFP
jgi:hypothetical protein